LLLFGIAQDIAHGASEPAFLAAVNVSAATCGGRFSGVHQWPVLGVHRGDYRPGWMGESGSVLDIAHYRVIGMPIHRPVHGLYDRLQRAEVDIVETRVGDERVDFWIDRVSHLPVRVASFRVVRAGSPPFEQIYRLGDYAPLEAIQMAGKVRTGDDTTDKVSTTFRFNVEYDDAVFNPVSVRFEKNGWMKR
jgi:hypothetical protein